MTVTSQEITAPVTTGAGKAPARDLLPGDHPLRGPLNDEIHARPPETLTPPCRVSYIALYKDKDSGPHDLEAITALAERFGGPSPDGEANHYVADLGAFRVKWERHTEFVRYTFYTDGIDGDLFDSPALEAVPADWLESLSGQVIVATHAALIDTSFELPNHESLSQTYFSGNAILGASVSGGMGNVFTDFNIGGDGFSRIILQADGLTDRQMGRTIQRLLEIDTYRVMALLALPVARKMNPFLTSSERDIAAITAKMISSSDDEEPALLDELTRLQAAIESRHADTHYRFSAAAAYHDLVRRRIEELREERIMGLPIIEEFIERRLAPAMNTCESTVRRQDALSQRVARAMQLLSTRVDMGSRAQNQAVLESLNRRAKIQLRLQETVEGLSIAAVTYYVVGLVGYLTKGLNTVGLKADPDFAMGLSVPIVVILVALGVRKVRKMVAERND